MIRLVMWLFIAGGLSAIGVLGYRLRQELRQERYEVVLDDRIKNRGVARDD